MSFSDKACIRVVAVSVPDAVGLVGEVEIGRSGAKRLHGGGEGAGGSDHPIVIGAVGPDRDRMEEVPRVPVREGSRLVGHGSYALPDAEDHHLAERRAERGQADGVLEERLDRGVAEFVQVLAARVEGDPPGRQRVEGSLEGRVRHRGDEIDDRAEVLERLHDLRAGIRVADVP